MATVKGPLTAPAWYSSQPMDGGLAQASPSMSVPLAYVALPAPRQGDSALRCDALASCGSALMLATPLGAEASCNNS